jgi:hypothetical protein
VLIAIVSDINTDVTEKAEVEVRKLRAQRIIDEDALMSESERSDQKCFPEYLEVMQARQTSILYSNLSNEGALLANKIDSVAADVAALKGLMTQLLDQQQT